MNYPKFRAMGLCVASGVVEGGCKHIVGTRLKQGGMRWTVAGANAIIAPLHCRERRFDDFWERREAHRHEISQMGRSATHHPHPHGSPENGARPRGNGGRSGLSGTVARAGWGTGKPTLAPFSIGRHEGRASFGRP